MYSLISLRLLWSFKCAIAISCQISLKIWFICQYKYCEFVRNTLFIIPDIKCKGVCVFQPWITQLLILVAILVSLYIIFLKDDRIIWRESFPSVLLSSDLHSFTSLNNWSSYNFHWAKPEMESELCFIYSFILKLIYLGLGDMPTDIQSSSSPLLWYCSWPCVTENWTRNSSIQNKYMLIVLISLCIFPAISIL